MPNTPGLLKIINNIGPIYMTSANLSGKKALKLKQARKVFNEITTYYDFGKGSGKPSKIIDLKTGEELR